MKKLITTSNLLSLAMIILFAIKGQWDFSIVFTWMALNRIRTEIEIASLKDSINAKQKPLRAYITNSDSEK